MSKQIYTEDQFNRLLEKLHELVQANDALRIEIAILRNLLAPHSLKDSFCDQPLNFPKA
jgi:regulator of replication initiation timing